MKKVLLVLAPLAMLFSVNIVAVQADAPINTSRDAAIYIDNDPHYIPANTSLWYRFDYGGDKSLILSKMFGATNSGIDYALYAPDQPDKAFARGTARNLPCGSGACPEADLTWKGAVPVAGIYYVEVLNRNPQPRTFYLVIVGQSVSYGPTLTTDPLPNVIQAPSNISPDASAPLQSNLVQVAPANASLWYRFDYNGSGSPIVISLADGRQTSGYFRVYTADQAKQADTNSAYVGEGGAATADCDTGKCLLGDLGWAGALPGPGTYYVQVYNASANAMSFRLLMEGEGISSGVLKTSPVASVAPTPTWFSWLLDWLQKK